MRFRWKTQPGWNVIKRYVLQAKQDLAFAETKPNQIKAKHGHCCGVCSVRVSCLKWYSAEEIGAVSAQHRQRSGFSLIYTQALTNDRCAQWCLKHFYEAVGVIKNVYYDGAERLAGRMLLITSYCFKWIRWAELLKSRFSQRFNPLKVNLYPEMKGRVRGELLYDLPHVICWDVEFSLTWN